MCHSYLAVLNLKINPGINALFPTESPKHTPFGHLHYPQATKTIMLIIVVFSAHQGDNFGTIRRGFKTR
jgi:hypothetical protein